MTTHTSSLVQSYKLWEEIAPDMVPRYSKIQENVQYKVSIYALDFAIIHRIEHVINFVIDWYKGTEMLNRPSTFRQLTPLHIAVITGHEGAVQKLIAAGVNVDSQDSAHWTALHHASLAHNRIITTILWKAGASLTMQSLTGGTIEDVLKCLRPPLKDSSISTELFGEKSDKPLTCGEFKQMTGAIYAHETYLTPELMLGEWNDAKAPKYEFPFEEKYAKQYSDLIKKLLMHQLKKVTHDSANQPLASSPGFGLYARCSFKAGELIGEYKGLFTDGSIVTNYSLRYSSGKGVDGLKYRNGIPQINDGFINVVLVPGRGIGGLSTRDLFVTAEDIKEGEQFCWNYSYLPHLKLFSPYAELRPSEARNFIKTHQVADLVECLKKVGKRTSTFEEFVKAEKFRYILQTPPVIFQMILDSTISSTQGEELLTLALDMKCIDPEEMIPDLQMLPKRAKDCLTLKQKLSKEAPYLVLKYDEFIRSLPAQFGLLSAFAGIENINLKLQALLSNREKGFSDPVSQKVVLLVWDKLVSEAKKDLQKLSDFFLGQIPDNAKI